MKYRCRCRRRACQARRNLSKHPDDYIRPPKCHIPGCNGTLRLDLVRQEKREKHPPVCRDPLCQHHRTTGKFIPFHRVSTNGCSGYNDWITARNTSPRSKHSPVPLNEWIPF